MTGADVVAAARGWAGTRYAHQASLKGVATDCIGLIAGVAAELGVAEAARWAQDARRRAYGPTPDPAMLRAAAADYMRLVGLSEAVPGDVLMLRFKREPQHFAFLASDAAGATMIHAWAGAGRVVEQHIALVWRRRIVGAYRFKGL